MTRITGADATFLYTETPTSSFEIGALLMLGTDGSQEPMQLFEHVRSRLASALDDNPLLRKRIRRVPFNLHHPVLADDPEFDLDYHVRHAALPAPGTPAQLQELLGRIQSRRLDHQRPLWEAYVIEGLEEGRSALFIRAHHASVDGLAGFQILTGLVDLEPDAPAPEPAQPWAPGRDPHAVRLLLDAGVDLARSPFQSARRVGGLMTDLARSVRPGSRSATEVVGASMAPPSPFNVHLSGRRLVRWFDIDQDEADAVRRPRGATVNDLALSLIGGMLRRYLVDMDAPTEPSLIAYMPISLGTQGSGNNTTVLPIRLGTDEPDPGVRMERIAADSSAAKERAQGETPPLILDVAGLTGPGVGALLEGLAMRARITERFRLAGNVSMSNVAAVPVPLFVGHAPVEAVYPFGPVSDGAGLDITLVGYQGRLMFGLHCDRASVPDPELLLVAFEEEWDAVRGA